jgi:hypothetical protein
MAEHKKTYTDSRVISKAYFTSLRKESQLKRKDIL